MEIQPGLTRVGAVDAEALRREAERAGYTTLGLPERGIVNKATFFEAVRRTLPQDPPLGIYNNWDGLSDSLCGGLYEHPARRIAILWLGTGSMATLAIRSTKCPQPFDEPECSVHVRHDHDGLH